MGFGSPSLIIEAALHRPRASVPTGMANPKPIGTAEIVQPHPDGPQAWAEALSTADNQHPRGACLAALSCAAIVFGERIDRHTTEPEFTTVLVYADGHPVGCAYGNTIEHGDR